MCMRRARACILRISVGYRPEQERSWTINTAGCPTKGDKSLLREDHRLWHSAAMRSSLRDLSDHYQRDGRYRTRAGKIIVSPKDGSLASGGCLTR
jgi:hypothetical protein